VPASSRAVVAATTGLARFAWSRAGPRNRKPFAENSCAIKGMRAEAGTREDFDQRIEWII
jgi:hypothetical protein